MQERFKMISSGYILLRRGNDVLLSRRFNTGWEDGNYGLPAGHIEDNETLRQGTAREVKEETGLDLNPTDLELKVVMHRKSADSIRVDFFFEPKKWSGEVKNMEPERCDDLNWFPLDNLPSNTIPYIREAIECWQNGTFYKEVGWGK